MLSRSAHPPWTERRGSRPGSCLSCRRRPSWSLMSESFDHWQIMWLQSPCQGSFACGWWRGIGSLGSRSGSRTCHKRTQIVNKELHSTSLTRLKKPKIFLPLLLSFRWKMIMYANAHITRNCLTYLERSRVNSEPWAGSTITGILSG